MNYPESQLILDEIKKAKRILLNCHRSPDPDSVGSALSMYLILQNLGVEKVSIISPDEIPNNCRFLPNSDVVKKEDFDKFDFTQYDLMIFLDSGNWNQVTGKERVVSSKIKKIVIDHHYTNPKYGDINIVDSNAGSCCNVLYKFAQDLEIHFDRDLSTTLLTGIIADTLSFQTDLIGDSTLSIADVLIKSGADRKNIIFNLYMTRPIDEIKLMGEMLLNVNVDDCGFAWVAISKKTLKKYPKSYDAKSYVAGSFIQSIENTNFGFVMEEKDEYSTVSFRSRKDFDVSKVAEELGGGGHKSASATRIYLPFDQAVEKVLEVCRKYANKNS
jgi:phosphoesterase RecJ-like protein